MLLWVRPFAALQARAGGRSAAPSSFDRSQPALPTPALHVPFPPSPTLNPFLNTSPPKVRDALVSERRRLTGLLAAVPFLEPYPSHANFVLCRVTQGRDAKAVKDALAQKVGGGQLGAWVGGWVGV